MDEVLTQNPRRGRLEVFSGNTELLRMITHPCSALAQACLTMEFNANVILDMECLAQTLDKCSGSPKMTKALSRKGSTRMEKKICEETDPDESPRKLVVKVTNLQVEPLKQPVIYNKYPNTMSSTTINPTLTDNNDSKIKKLNRFGSLRPRKILLIFASLSSMGDIDTDIFHSGHP